MYPIPCFPDHGVLMEVGSGFAVIFHELNRSDPLVIYLLIPVGQIGNRNIEQGTIG